MLTPVIVVLLALGWCGLWYYTATVTNRALGGWVEREAAAGRVYSCESQAISGFPFRVEARCAGPAAQLNSNQPPLAVTAKEVSFSAQLYRPNAVVGDVTGPLTVAQPGQLPSFIAAWSLARIAVSGLAPLPDSIAVTLDRAHLDQVTGATASTILSADHADLDGRIVAGSAANHPVIDVVLQFTGATAPTLHPLVADPLKGEVQVELRGFNDLAPKPWAARFHEMQASGGAIEIKAFRIERSDAVVVGNGTLTVNDHGRLDGLVAVAIAGLDHIVPLLGIDRAIGQGLDRLTGGQAQGLGALDRLMPGLGGAVRQGATATVIDSLNKMGQPTTIDKKPAILLPLRFSDGSVYLGMMPLGQVPPLF